LTSILLSLKKYDNTKQTRKKQTFNFSKIIKILTLNFKGKTEFLRQKYKTNLKNKTNKSKRPYKS